MIRRFLLIFIPFFIALNSLSSQQFYFKKYQVEDGLSHNSVRCILQDSFGFIWFGTGGGLNRFDGYSFKIYKSSLKDKFSLGHNSVQALYEDDNKDIWVGTTKGIFIFDHTNESFVPFSAKTQYGVLISSEVQKIIKAKNGLIWIVTLGQGFFIYNPHNKTLVQNSNETAFIWDVTEDFSGRIYLSSKQEGLICFDQNGKYKESYTSFFDGGDKSDYRINCISSINDKIWFGVGTNKLNSLNVKTSKIDCYNNDDTSIGAIRCISKYSEKELLVGADNGLYIFDMLIGQFTQINTLSDPRGLSDQSIQAILKDREGGYWISTSLGGVNYLAQQTKNFEYYNPTFNLNRVIGKVVNSFCEDRNRNIWIGSQDGLRILDNKTQTLSIFTFFGKDLKYDVRSLLLDGDNLWVGTFGDGLKIVNTKNHTITEYYHQREIHNSLCSNDILSLRKDKNGNIYVGTTWGMCKYNRETNDFTTLNYVGSMISVLDILEDSHGDLWIATANSGLFRYGLENWHWFHYTNIQGEAGSINSNSVISLFEDASGKVWFGTDGGGLCSYNPEANSFEDFDPEDKILPSKVIYSIEEDNIGNLWLSTNAGLLRINPNNKNDLKIFMQENGLQSNQFNARSSLKASNGKFYFGGINGFNAFYPDEFRENSYIPPVYIVGLRLYKKGDGGQATKLDLETPLHIAKDVTLPFDQNNFILQFAALSYEDTPRNNFCYKLEGFDNEWIYTKENTASYANLPPGTYTFQVKASNNDGKWNKEGATLKVVISPPWWRMDFAYATYILIFIALIYFIIRYNARRTNEKIQKEVEEYNIRKEKEVYQSKIGFFVNLVHEIRTPLSLIKLPLDRVSESISPSEKASTYLSIVNKNVDYLLNVVNQLLDFQKIENHKPQLYLKEQNVNILIQDIYDQFVDYLELRSIKFELQLPEEEKNLLVDKEILTKIIVNLLSNAMKFANGLIIMELECKNECFSVSVSDDGSGIADDEKSKIFEAFYQTHKLNNKGTGIGLAYSKLLSESHNGHLVVEDNELGGATFKLTIPVNGKIDMISDKNEIAIIDIKSDDNQNEERKFKSCRVLFVEDNLELLNMTSDLLSEHFIIIKAHDGREALQVLERENVDIIISDVMMPDVDGFTLCHTVKSDINICHIPVILLTAKVTTEAKIEGMEHGADVYIEKPFSIKHLRMQIENLLKLRLAFQQMVLNMPTSVQTSSAISNRDREFLSKLQDEIDKHISEPNFSIDDLASKMFMSRSNFYRKIKSVSGMAPNDYLKAIRLNKAAELLKEDGTRILDVYVQVGFNSSSYFAKCFKAQFGILPKDYFEKHGNQMDDTVL